MLNTKTTMDPFTESLISDVLPHASPFRSPSHVSSPVKTRGSTVRTRQAAGPNLADENSVDIYGDILEDITTPKTPGTPGKDREQSVPSQTRTGRPQDEETGDQQQRRKFNADDLSEIEKLRLRIQELEATNAKLSVENKTLETSKVQVTKNISCLFMTSRNELLKKDAEIEQLKKTITEFHTTSQTLSPSNALHKPVADKELSSLKSPRTILQKSPRRSTDHEDRQHSPKSLVKESSNRDHSSSSKSRKGQSSSSERSRRDHTGKDRKGQSVRTSKKHSSESPAHSHWSHGRGKSEKEKTCTDKSPGPSGKSRSEKSSSCHRLESPRGSSSSKHSESHSSKKTGSKEANNDGRAKVTTLDRKGDSGGSNVKGLNKNKKQGKGSKSVVVDNRGKDRSPVCEKKDVSSEEEVFMEDTQEEGVERMDLKEDGNLDLMETGSSELSADNNGKIEGKKDLGGETIEGVDASGGIAKHSEPSTSQLLVESRLQETSGDGDDVEMGDETLTKPGSGDGQGAGDGLAIKGTDVDEGEMADHDLKQWSVSSNNVLPTAPDDNDLNLVNLESLSHSKSASPTNHCNTLSPTLQSPKPCDTTTTGDIQVKDGKATCDDSSVLASSSNLLGKGTSIKSKQVLESSLSQSVPEDLPFQGMQTTVHNKQILESSLQSVPEDLSLQGIQTTVHNKQILESSLQSVPEDLSLQGIQTTVHNKQILESSLQSVPEDPPLEGIQTTAHNKQILESSLQSVPEDPPLQGIQTTFHNKQILESGASPKVSRDTSLHGIELTNCVLSNTEWASLSNTSSLPFTRIISADKETPKMDIEQNDANNQAATNQTWPFENRAPTSVYSEDMSASIGEKVVMSDEKALTCRNTDTKRAFPISEIENGSDSSSLGLVKPLETCTTGSKSESNSGDHNPDSVPSVVISEASNSNSGSSGPGESSSKDSNKSAESSSQSQHSSTKSESRSKDIDFRSPLKSTSLWTSELHGYEDNTNLTPPRPRVVKLSTPGKSHKTVTPSTSSSIMCTPNLIMLGDEETTCATILSPFKSHSVPSEFIPPGVRKEIKEFNTHFRHIRGEPELLHETSLLQVGIPAIKVDSVDSDNSSSASNEKSGNKLAQKINSTSSPDEYSSVVCEPTSDEPTLKPIVEKAFKEVFRKDFSIFKDEMSKISKESHKTLVSNLKKSAQVILKSKGAKKTEVEAVLENPPKVVSVEKQVQSLGEEDEAMECETEELDKRKVEDTSSVVSHTGEKKESQSVVIDDSVWHSSFNIKNYKAVKPKSGAKKSHSHHQFFTTKSFDDEESDQLSFKGRIWTSDPINQAADDLIENKEKQPSDPLPKSDGQSQPEKICHSPNSCRVTSSSVQIADNEMDCEPSTSCMHHAHPVAWNNKELLKSLEPDSTSDPVVEKSEECTGVSPKDSGNGGEGNASVRDEKSQSPDSPTKHFNCLAKIRKSPKKLLRQKMLADDNSFSPGGSSSVEKLDGLGQVNSDLYMSSSDSSDESESDEETLNATLINKAESEIGTEEDKTKLSLFNRSCSEDIAKVGGETPVAGWNEVSLMETNSLSEFDQDVLEHQRQARAGRGSSRATSISSHLSVGGFSPLSVSSVKLSTPSHVQSPKGSMWSPLNRSSETQDSCQEDVRTPRSEGLFEFDAIRSPQQMDTAKSINSSTERIACQQLSRLLTLQELQRLQLVKNSFVSHCSSSESDNNSSCSESDGSSSSSCSSDDEDCHTPVKRNTLQSPKNSPLSQRLLSGLTQSPRASKRLMEKSPLVKKMMLESNSPRRSPRKKAQANKAEEEVRHVSHDPCLQSPIRTPSKRSHVVCNKKMSGKKSVQKSLNEEFVEKEHEDLCGSRLQGLELATSSPRKSVKIVEDNSSCDSILIGVCGAASDDSVLLKRLRLSNSKSCSSLGPSPSAKSRNNRAEVGKTKTGDTARKAKRKVKSGLGRCQSETETGGNSTVNAGVGRRPLSLQEDNDLDPFLVSASVEHVKNVMKVVRRLDLDKSGKGKRQDTRSKCRERVDGKRNDKEMAVSVSSETRISPDDTRVGGVNDVSVDVEEGEIVDEESVLQDEIESPNPMEVKSRHGGTRKMHEESVLHITQDSCKVLQTSKSMSVSVKRGKNFASKKESSHGLSPMARIYTPPSSASCSYTTEENTTKEVNVKDKTKSCIRGKGNKRLRSMSPMSPEKKPSKLQRKESPPTSKSRHAAEKTSRRSDRYRSPNTRRMRPCSPHSGPSRHSPPTSRNRCRPVSINARNRSVERRDVFGARRNDNRQRSPIRRSNWQRSPVRSRYYSPVRGCSRDSQRDKCIKRGGPPKKRLSNESRDDRLLPRSVWASRMSRRRNEILGHPSHSRHSDDRQHGCDSDRSSSHSRDSRSSSKGCPCRAKHCGKQEEHHGTRDHHKGACAGPCESRSSCSDRSQCCAEPRDSQSCISDDCCTNPSCTCLRSDDELST